MPVVPKLLARVNQVRSSGVLLVLSGGLLISFSGVWVALADVPATTSAFYRVFFGTLCLACAAGLNHEFKSLLEVKWLLALFCGLAFAFDLLFWHTSILYIGPGLATILGNFQVFLMTACGVAFFGERLSVRFLSSLPLALIGLFILVGHDWTALSAQYKTGIYLGLLTAICYTVYLLLLRKIHGKHGLTLRFAPLLIVSAISAAALGSYMAAADISFAIPNLKSGIALVCLGLFSQAIGWMLITMGMPTIRASLTGLILLLQPALSFIWDVLFFSRQTSTIDWLGVSIALGAIYLGITARNRS